MWEGQEAGAPDSTRRRGDAEKARRRAKSKLESAELAESAEKPHPIILARMGGAGGRSPGLDAETRRRRESAEKTKVKARERGVGGERGETTPHENLIPASVAGSPNPDFSAGMWESGGKSPRTHRGDAETPRKRGEEQSHSLRAELAESAEKLHPMARPQCVMA